MAGFDADTLFDLLPALYRRSDDAGDLHAFLGILAPTLDGLKADIDLYPLIIDVLRCEPRFLTLIARSMGLTDDPQEDLELRRRRIIEAVPAWRRKSTPAAIVRDLKTLGWRGRFVEGFPVTMRLGIHSTLGASRPAGRLYNDGTAVITCEGLVDIQQVRAALKYHQPVGTRFFLLGRQAVINLAAPGLRAWEMRKVRMAAIAPRPDVFRLCQSYLGGQDRLASVRFIWADDMMLARRPCLPFRLMHSRLGRYDRLTRSTLDITDFEEVYHHD